MAALGRFLSAYGQPGAAGAEFGARECTAGVLDGSGLVFSTSARFLGWVEHKNAKKTTRECLKKRTAGRWLPGRGDSEIDRGGDIRSVRERWGICGGGISPRVLAEALPARSGVFGREISPASVRDGGSRPRVSRELRLGQSSSYTSDTIWENKGYSRLLEVIAIIINMD